MKKILIPLAEGFEEIEAVTNIDVLRRAGVNVVTASLNSLQVQGSHGIVIQADINIAEANKEEFDGIVLPGGMPGSENLKNNDKVIQFVKNMYENKKLVAAICAAPIALEYAGILKGKKATSYPGFEKQMGSCNYSEDRVVIEENIITSRGPGVAMEFALEIVSYLISEEKKEQLKKGMLTNLC